MRIEIPYGRGAITADLPSVKAILRAEQGSTNPSPAMELGTVLSAMEAPIGSPLLRELAAGKERILLIASDHTRPVPSKIIVPLMLTDILTGSPEAEIVILIATGSHRETTREELEAKFGPDIVRDFRIEIHRADDADQMADIGELPSGGRLVVNKWALWADLIVSEGFIEPHFFAGFSGGRKSILPGICARQTVHANHCAKFIADPSARTGILDGNPIHRDMVSAVKQAGLAYIVNVVLDEEKRVVAAFAGDPIEAHAEGCRLVGDRFRVKAVEGDIVITSNGGYPLDQNIYQAVKGMTAAEACVRQGGVIILCAQCSNGHGGEAFFQWFNGATARQVSEKIAAIPMEQTLTDQWQAQILARVMEKAHVIMVSDPSMADTIRAMGLGYAETPEDALTQAKEKTDGREIVVIPDGVGVIVE